MTGHRYLIGEGRAGARFTVSGAAAFLSPQQRQQRHEAARFLSEGMMANMVASPPRDAVLAISTSIGTIASWLSGPEIVVSVSARLRARSQPVLEPIKETDVRQREDRARHDDPEQREAHRPLHDRATEDEEADEAQHRRYLRQQPEEALTRAATSTARVTPIRMSRNDSSAAETTSTISWAQAMPDISSPTPSAA
jgi:hypothetical protein